MGIFLTQEEHISRQTIHFYKKNETSENISPKWRSFPSQALSAYPEAIPTTKKPCNHRLRNKRKLIVRSPIWLFVAQPPSTGGFKMSGIEEERKRPAFLIVALLYHLTGLVRSTGFPSRKPTSASSSRLSIRSPYKKICVFF
jgi:hypothetical protein